MNHLHDFDPELVRAQTVARPYLRLIEQLLAGTLTPGEFAEQFEQAWEVQEGKVPDQAYESINHLYGVVEAYDPAFAAEGDEEFTDDAAVLAAATRAQRELERSLR